MGNPGWAGYKTNSPNIFKQKVIMLKICILLYKQAIPDRMEFF